MSAGADSYMQIRSAPFDGTVMPIAYIPDWTKTANQDKTKRFEDIQIADYLSLPTYDPTTLQSDMSNTTKMSVILHYTYTTPYMGSYRFNYKENDGSHLGVDIRSPIGTPVLSIANGVVVRTVEADTTGNKFVVIRHDGVPIGGKMVSLYSGYLHLSQISVTEGTKIAKWEMLGRVGITGIATTPHLHIQIDTADAPFHPYWPFTSSDSRNAGLGFFESVNAGLGKENALKYTVNPMTFINTYLWGVAGGTLFSSAPKSPIALTAANVLSDDEATREREMMLGSYTSTPGKICEKKRFSDIGEKTKFGQMLYSLSDNKCLFQRSGDFAPKDTITLREATMTIMQYYNIGPAPGISHFLDIDIDDDLQWYAVVLYRRGLVDGNYFLPDKIVTKIELIDLIVKIGNIPANPGQIHIYPDVDTMDPYWASAQAYGYFTRVHGSRLYPNTILTRATLVQLISNVDKVSK
jgi:Peptidase family M23